METIAGYTMAMLIIVAVIVSAVISFIKATPEKRKALINQVLYALAIEAERLYGSKTGQAKKMQVTAWFYERYKWIGWFLPEATLGDWIDEVVAKMNEWVKSNPVGAANLLGN